MANNRVSNAHCTRRRDQFRFLRGIDLETELILTAEIYHANHGDSQTLADTAMAAQTHLSEAGCKEIIEEVVADKGCHAAEQLELVHGLNLRTYLPEPERRGKPRLSEKPLEVQRAVKGNRRRTKT